jgi:hypothetical protein
MYVTVWVWCTKSWNTVFTWMQDNCSLRPPPKKHVSQGTMYLAKLRPLLKNKMSAKKKYFPVNFTHSVHKARQILSVFTNQCHCFASSQSVPSSSHSLLTSPAFSLSFHIIWSSVPSTALDIKNLLKTLHSHFWWDALPCHYDLHRLCAKFIFIGL